MLDLVADVEMRAVAFAVARRLQDENGGLSRADLINGFRWGNGRIRLDGHVEGIWKPREMGGLLSIKTAWPRQRRERPALYADQRQALREHFEAADVLDYNFQRGGPDLRRNQWLLDAKLRRIPILYLMATSPGFYQAFLPAYIVEWDDVRHAAKVAFGFDSPPETARERRIGIAIARRQFDHAGFQEDVLAAYRERCAISDVAGRSHVSAAELAPAYGPASALPGGASAGVALSKLHRSAFDADLLGIDADGRVHVSERAAEYRIRNARQRQPDAPMIDALLAADGERIRQPERPEARPDRELLDRRFQQFRQAN